MHPAYGTLRDFRAFVREAHARGLRVITELVMNHTSRPASVVPAARARREQPEARLLRVERRPEASYASARIIFTDTETSNWAWDPVAQQYYWHRFFSHQPDLNYDNPHGAARDARVDALLARHGRGRLRLDAVPYLVEREGTNGENLPETHAFLKRLRAALDERYQGRHAAGRGQPVAARTCAPTSATATSATWPSTSR